MRGRDLNAVEPGLRRQRRRGGVAGDDRLHLGRTEGPRLDLEALRRNRRWGERGRSRRARDQLAAAVEELDEEPRPARLDRLGDPPVAGDDLVGIAGERPRRQTTGPVDGSRLEDDEADPAAGARLVVGGEVVGRQVVVHEHRLVRREDDPVRKLDRAEAG